MNNKSLLVFFITFMILSACTLGDSQSINKVNIESQYPQSSEQEIKKTDTEIFNSEDGGLMSSGSDVSGNTGIQMNTQKLNSGALDLSGTGMIQGKIENLFNEIAVDDQGVSCELSDSDSPILAITGTHDEMFQSNKYPIFAKDNKGAYFNNDKFKNNGKIIKNADVQTFLIGNNELGLGYDYATDKDSLYLYSVGCRKISPFSRDTFTIKVFPGGGLFSADKDNVYFWMMECGDGCFMAAFHKIKGADPKSFEVISNDWENGAFSKDSKNVYRSIVSATGSVTYRLEGANPEDFTILSIQVRD